MDPSVAPQGLAKTGKLFLRLSPLFTKLCYVLQFSVRHFAIWFEFERALQSSFGFIEPFQVY